MSNSIRFALVLHNHQPVGNFDSVFEQAYQESYRPFLETFGPYESLKLSLHTSGSLMEWLDARHPQYVDRLAELAAQGRMEIVGGAFFEPILAMLPSRDRKGQIKSYTAWLENRLRAKVRGMWVAERVWEQSYVRDLVDAGIEYTVLDDFHFKNAGLKQSELAGHYVTEDDGRVMSVFPGNEQLRYLIPFGSPEQTIDLLRQIAELQPNATVVFGDDGEKFGTWPGTHKHVYSDGWLKRFLDALCANQDWINVTTLSEAMDNVPPVGRIYLPDSSYREMTEWVLPSEELAEYERLSHEMDGHPFWPAMKRFVRGGFWRNFKVKYEESNEMYSRMMGISRRLEQAEIDGSNEYIEQARKELYRGQCNCGYWHGAFGGIYLPHLRNAIFEHLISADNLLDKAIGREAAWIEAKAQDLDFDSRQEVQLSNDKLTALIAPSRGGQLYELDVRSIKHNILATFTRHPEAYHRKVLAGPKNEDGCASIHDRVVFKQDGLDQRLQYDDHARKSMLDLFYPNDATLESVASGQAVQIGDFVDGVYETRVRRNPERIQVLLSRQGYVGQWPIKVSKGVTLSAGSNELEIAYVFEGLPEDQPLHFGVEFNFAGLPAGMDDRYFYDREQNKLGQLGSKLNLTETDSIGMVDEWLGIDAKIKVSRSTNFWTFPIETVSQSESGFELVHQSVVVQPHWYVTADEDGCWSAAMRVSFDTSRAGNHTEGRAVASAT